ncbi:MAG: glycoside hydrolase [Muribaculaceae bacterium]|nr:glycoside hydrolase [Muribaculaceae bacterium]
MTSYSKRIFTGVICCMAMCITYTSKAQQKHVETWNDGIMRSLVYCPGDYNSSFYRIPAIVTAADGSLVTVADKRIEHNGDLPAKIDIVSRRRTDGGKTWND